MHSILKNPTLSEIGQVVYMLHTFIDGNYDCIYEIFRRTKLSRVDVDIDRHIITDEKGNRFIIDATEFDKHINNLHFVTLIDILPLLPEDLQFHVKLSDDYTEVEEAMISYLEVTYPHGKPA